MNGGAAGDHQRRRCDRAGRIDVAGGQRHSGHRAGIERGGGLRSPERQHHRLAQRAGLCPGRLSPERAARRVVGRHGCGSQYFSQQCVFRLAPKAGITNSRAMSPMPRNSSSCRRNWKPGIQARSRSGRAWATSWATAWRTMPTSTSLKHVLILGRCTSGAAGRSSSTAPTKCSRPSSPSWHRVHIQLPDEKSRRVGQSIAAASLPRQSLQQIGEQIMKFQSRHRRIVCARGLAAANRPLARTTHLAIARIRTTSKSWPPSRS